MLQQLRAGCVSRDLVTLFTLADPSEALLKLLGLACGQVSVQIGTWPP